MQMKDRDNKLWVYDVESYPNFFSYTAKHVGSDTSVQFVLSPWRDDKEDFLTHLKELQSGKCGMIGYNNLHYDQYMIQAFMDEFVLPGVSPGSAELIARRLYGVSQGVIGAKENKHDYKKSEIQQLDLMKLNHFDYKSKRTSLKALMVRFCWHNVEDLPYHWSQELTRDQEDKVLEYNLNDVLFTEFFYHKCAEKIAIRRRIGTRLKRNMFNMSDVAMGEFIFLHRLSEKMDVPVGALRKQGSPAREVPLKDVIFPYVEFQTPEFKSLLEKMKGTVVSPDQIQQYKDKVAQMASELNTNELAAMLESRGLGNNRSAKRSKKNKGADKKGFNYQVNYNSFLYVFGIGGIHGCVRPGVYRSNEEYVIIDTNATSYYPSIAIENGLHPRHLPKQIFVDTYRDIRTERVEAKQGGDMETSDGLKLSLNGVFGKSGDKFSPFYDPYFFMGITINGQLMMTMFAESVECADIGAQILQINTDGVTFRIPRKNMDTYLKLAEKWSEKTMINMEHNHYEVMAIRDVNNYLAKDTKGKVKEKGSYETDPEWHKDNSFLAVRLAARNYLLDGKKIDDTFKEVREIFPYCGRYKATPGFHPLYVFLSKDKDGNHTPARAEFGETLRFVPTKIGGKCVKKHDDGREIELLAGWSTMPYNKAEAIGHQDIDMSFFRARAIQKIEEINMPQLDFFVEPDEQLHINEFAEE